MADILQVVSNARVECYVPVSKSLITSEPPWDARANGMFLGGGDILRNRKYNMQSGTQLGEFRPTSLTLFHLALLAHIVHVEYPLYSLFKSQCYWFASTVFSAAQIIDKDLSRGSIPTGGSLASDETGDEKFDDIFLPYHLYVPKKAGCWKGVQIGGCKNVVLGVILQKFYKDLARYDEKVFLYFFRITTVF
jgi:hypothetical protein